MAHLDHIARLGVDVVWLSPVYKSPQDDNGYDISDYQAVDPLFGTIADLDDLIRAVHERGMRLIMDLVVNHTSDEHPWFVESRRSSDSSTADWYFWRDPRPGAIPGTPGAEPNNWGSAFSGSAWQWVPERGQYYLHLFSVKQPDLNWDNPDVRDAVFAMMTWWLDRGVDGFRMDVINFISKDPALPDGSMTPTGYGDGMPYFSYGPQIHTYLAEMKRRVFDPRPGSYLTVGEMPGVTTQQAREFTDHEHGELNMVFQFEHVLLDHDGDKWTNRRVTVRDLRNTFTRWQNALADTGWNSLYWNNHDQPRVVSRFGDDARYWRESATALATVLHLHRGTPYIYQGEELGMTNVSFNHIEDFRDIESLNYFANATRGGESPSAVLETLRHKSRDNARTPMQWSAGAGAGFSDATPWIAVNANHTWLNAAAQVDDENSVYQYYRALIALRHSDSVVVDGDFIPLLEGGPADLYAFRRSLAKRWLDVFANLSGQTIAVTSAPGAMAVVLGNYPAALQVAGELLPWEVRVCRS